MKALINASSSAVKPMYRSIVTNSVHTLYVMSDIGLGCEGYTIPITRIPFQGKYQDDGNHNDMDTLQYESLGDET